MHCSCLHACLAAYPNISRRDLNTTCITINRGVWRHGRGSISGRSDELGGFWSKPSIKSGDKNHIKVVSTYKVLWSDRLNTSRVTENRLEDRFPQYEATKRSVGLSTARVVDPTETSITVSTTVNGDCSTSHRRPVHEVGWRRSRRWSTSRLLDDGWSRLKTRVYCEVVRALSCLHTNACKG